MRGREQARREVDAEGGEALLGSFAGGVEAADGAATAAGAALLTGPVGEVLVDPQKKGPQAGIAQQDMIHRVLFWSHVRFPE